MPREESLKAVRQFDVQRPQRAERDALQREFFPRAKQDFSQTLGSTRALACSHRRLADGFDDGETNSAMTVIGARLRRGAATSTRLRRRNGFVVAKA